MYCNICKKTISKEVYDYSLKYFGKPLCMTHQKQEKSSYNNKTSYPSYTPKSSTNSKVTPQALALYNALRKRKVRCKLEAYDGYKHVDIRIEDARIDIEVDGKQHILSHKQMYADMKRTEGSQEDEFYTMRYSNSDIDENVELIADNIAKVARKRKREEDDFW